MAELKFNMNTTEFMMENQIVPLSKRREYLGMSGLGGKCLRALWYSFHWASPQEQFPIRTKRIFDRGDLEEARIISELRNCGFIVYRIGEEKEIKIMTGAVGEEQEELVGFAGHARGHPDGRVAGLPELPGESALLEMKTAKASKFREFQKNKVFGASKTYFGQAQRYMDAMGLEWCLFIVTNKDTEERYYELIPYDAEYAAELLRREIIIITSTEPPEKLSQNKNWLDCKWCQHHAVCHEDKEPPGNCRTCEHIDIADDGVWECKHYGVLNYDQQITGCSKWGKGWGL
jgi:hypothetical protein